MRKKIQVIDLFCGMGGFSEGVKQSQNATVILAVDNWKEALDIHQLNHPESQHLQMNLGEYSNAKTWKIMQSTVQLQNSDHLHIHGSPPCQNISRANNRFRNLEEGLRLVKWFLNFVRYVKCDSWSMEQVSHPVVVELVSLYSKNVMIKCNFYNYGVPQKRIRLLCGQGVDFSHMTPIQPLTNREILEHWNVTSPVLLGSGGQYAQTSIRYAKTIDDNVFPTVVGSRSGSLIHPRTHQLIRYFTLQENLLLQTFPETYQMTQISRQKRQQMIGNSIPPIIGTQIMHCVKQ